MELSDEEIKAIEWFKEDLTKGKEEMRYYNEYKKQVIKRNEKLLNLIYNQQKEIEEIKYKYEKAMETNKCLYQFDNKASIDKFYISKDKIRELLKSKDIELTGVISYRELEELL